MCIAAITKVRGALKKRPRNNMPQFTLPLSLPAVFSADNFFVSDSNQDAHAWITRWPDWAAHVLIISGPAGSGKSHLAHIWALRASAVVMAADGIAPERATTHVLVEDIELCKDERALFHLFNQCKENGVSLLLTSACEPSALPFTLPDLTSRLKAAPLAIIHAPDDAVIAAALRKQFTDRQLMVDDEVLSYIAARMERTLSGVTTVVATLDEQALAEQKNITIPFVKKILGY